MEISFRNKKVNIQSLLSFGFVRTGEEYIFSTPIAFGDMVFACTVGSDGSCFYTVSDAQTGDEYTLHEREDSAGSFVGQVREDCDRILSAIEAQCYDRDAFRCESSSRILEYAKEKYGDAPDFPFGDESAVLRNRKSGKWYGIIITARWSSLGISRGGKVEILNLKQEPCRIPRLTDTEGILPAYHMNKKHWVSVLLDGSVDFLKICDMLDESYRLIEGGKKK